MSTEAARAIVAHALRKVTGLDLTADPADDAASLRDLGVSSLMLYEFVSALEDAGGFRFDDSEVDSANFRILGSVIVLVSRYLS
jgi:acyl carrier protein